MSTLTRHVVIDAPADTVWEVIAGRFDRIGEWAAAIPPRPPYQPMLASPTWPLRCRARVCETGIRALPRVTETIVGFQAANRP